MVHERTSIQREHTPLQITSGVKTQFQEIARWALILSVISFVIISTILLAATYTSINMGVLRGGSGLSSLTTGFGYLIVGTLMLIPVMAGYRFATFLKLALAKDDQSAMDKAFLHLKSGLRYSGLAIFMLLFIALFLVYVVPYFENTY